MLRGRSFSFSQAMIVAVLSVTILGCGDNSNDRNDSPKPLLPKNTSFNRLTLEPKADGAFRFMTLGHLYGRPGKGRPRPSTTFVKSVPKLQGMDIDLGVLMGDCFYRWDPDEIKGTTEILKKLPFPVINSVGNHDVTRRDEYEELFGDTWYAFSYAGSRFIIFDSEIDSWHISGKQLEVLTEELARCSSPKTAPKNFFLFTHKVVWAGTRETAVCAVGSNDPSSMSCFSGRPPERPTFNRDIRPRLRQASQHVPIYFFAGDIGAFPDKVHLFHQKDTHEGAGELYYLASGIGDQDRDAAIIVDVDANGKATLRSYNFKTAEFGSLEKWNSAYWNPKILPNGKIPNAMIPYLEK